MGQCRYSTVQYLLLWYMYSKVHILTAEVGVESVGWWGEGVQLYTGMTG